MKRCCATPTYKKQQHKQQRLRYTRSSMHPLPCSPLRVRSAHCFSEAAKLLIKAFAFYIWRTRAHTHTHTRTHKQCTQAYLYIYRTYIFISYMGACHLCGRFGHNRAASYATKMRVAPLSPRPL